MLNKLFFIKAHECWLPWPWYLDHGCM